MSASGSESNVNDPEFVESFKEWADSNPPLEEPEDEPHIWAVLTYEEGTSGPLKTVDGLLVDDSSGMTVLDPETGTATIVTERFLVKADLVAMEVEDEGQEAPEGSSDE